MSTIKEIFSYSKNELQKILKEYKDETDYNKLEKINAVIILLFNNNKLNDEDSKIVKSDEYDLVMKKLNSTKYEDFINLYKELITKKIIVKTNKFKKVNITIDPELLKTWNCIKTLGHNNYVLSFCISNNFLISCSYNYIKIWDITDDFKFIKEISLNNAYRYSIVANDDYIFISENKGIKVLHQKTFNLKFDIHAHFDTITSLVLYNKNGKNYLISASKDLSIQIFDLNYEYFESIKILEGHKFTVNQICVFSDDNINYIISCSDDKTIKIWDIDNDFICKQTLQEHNAAIACIGIINIDKDTNYIISASDDRIFKVWNLKTFKSIATFDGHTDYIKSISSFKEYIVDKNNKTIIHNYMVSTSNDKTIKIWNFDNNFKCIATLEGHIGDVECCTIANINNHNYIISGSDDRSIKVWEKN
jgi:WD40 repeat protein